MTQIHLKQLLQELKTGIQGLYGNRLKGLYLYGSYARGEQDPGSDLDLLIVLDDYKRYGEEVEKTGQLSSDLSLKYGVTVSSVFTRESEWLHGESPFLRNVRPEAKAA